MKKNLIHKANFCQFNDHYIMIEVLSLLVHTRYHKNFREKYFFSLIGVDGKEQLQVSNVLWPVRWMKKHYLISITKSLKALSL